MSKPAICLFSETKYSLPFTDRIPNFLESRPYPITSSSNFAFYGLHSLESDATPPIEERSPPCAGQLSIVAIGQRVNRTRLKGYHHASGYGFAERIHSACTLLRSRHNGWVSEANMCLHTGLAIWCMGSGYNLVLRSILVQLVEPAYRGTLLTTVVMLENASSVVAGPLFSLSFRAGLALSGGENGGGSPLWIGLPFMVAAVLLCSTVVVLYIVRVQ